MRVNLSPQRGPPVTSAGCRGSHVYDPSERKNVTDGRARVAGGKVRGAAAPPAGRRLSHAWLAERGRGGCPRKLAPAQWNSVRRGRGSWRLVDDRRRPHLAEHAPFTHNAERDSPARSDHRPC